MPSPSVTGGAAGITSSYRHIEDVRPRRAVRLNVLRAFARSYLARSGAPQTRHRFCGSLKSKVCPQPGREHSRCVSVDASTSLVVTGGYDAEVHQFARGHGIDCPAKAKVDVRGSS